MEWGKYFIHHDITFDQAYHKGQAIPFNTYESTMTVNALQFKKVKTLTVFCSSMKFE